VAEVFVYGTLRKHRSAHDLIKRAPGRFIKEVRTANKYHLYDVGSFPGMIEDDTVEGQGILGEVWEIPQAAFKDLDRYECVNSGLFRRGEVHLEDGTSANAYFFTSDMQNAVRIESGVWK
jgi:gamma-glutamylcyclotransferase (GGCT)/AIG2-like uncharacterized protein YtfP